MPGAEINIDWKSLVKNDWKDIAGVVADDFDLDEKTVQSLIPVPVPSELLDVGEAINDFREMLDDGAIDAAKVARLLGDAASKVIGDVIVAAATAAGTAIPIPIAGNLIGSAIGGIISSVISMFDDSDQKRRAAITKARNQTKANVEKWEQDVFDGAWLSLAKLSEPRGGGSKFSDMFAHWQWKQTGLPCPDPTNCWSADDEELSAGFKARARNLLVSWGFKPAGKRTSYGNYSGSALSFGAADAAYEEPFPARKTKGAMGQVFTEYNRPGKGWMAVAPTDEERFAAWTKVVEERTEEEQKIANAFLAYFSQLSALRNGFGQTIQRSLSTGALAKPILTPNLILLKKLRFQKPRIIGGGGFSISGGSGGSSGSSGSRRGSSGLGIVIPLLALGGLGWFLAKRR